MKRISKILFVLLLFVVTLNVKAISDEYAQIENKELTETNLDVFGDGKVSFDLENRVLTLTDYTFNINEDKDNFHDDGGSVTRIVSPVYFNFEDEFTLKLVGNNIINYNGELKDTAEDVSFLSIYSEHSLNIEGTGTLTVNLNDATLLYGLVSNLDLTTDGPTFNFNFSNVSAGYGIEVVKCFNMKNSKFIIDAKDASSSFVGVEAQRSMLVENSSFDVKVDNSKATAGILSHGDSSFNKLAFNMIETNGGTLDSYGIASFGTVSINESTFDIDIEHEFNIIGMYLGETTINNSKINMNLKAGSLQHYGIFSVYNLNFAESIFKMVFDEEATDSIAIQAENITFDKGTYLLGGKINGEVTYNNIEVNDVLTSETSFDTLGVVDTLDTVKDCNYILINTEGTFEYLEGKDTTIEKDDTDLLKFRIDGNYILFKSLKIDGVEFILNTDYTVSEGSTIITLTSTGMTKINALDTATYNVEATFLNNIVSTTTLTLANDSNPNTLDNIIISILMMILSLLSLISISLYLNKEANN